MHRSATSGTQTLLLAFLQGIALASSAWGTPPTCTNSTISLTDDYSFIIGSADYADPDSDAEFGSTFRWLVNGAPFAGGPVAQLLALHLDGSLASSGGETPLTASGIAYDTGRWGSALALQSGGSLSFARHGNLDLNEGTIEMWIALRAPGDDPVYSSRSHYLFLYLAPNGDYISITWICSDFFSRHPGRKKAKNLIYSSKNAVIWSVWILYFLGETEFVVEVLRGAGRFRPCEIPSR